MERRLGYDFGQVRVHADTAAAESAAAIGALAYTVGRHVVFGAGQYAPNTQPGRRLLAHELAHVAQQAAGAQIATRSLERDATARAGQALGSMPLRAGALRALPAPPSPILQRYAVPGDLRCDQLVDWLNAQSPYAPEWAETRCNYSFEGGLQTRNQTLSGGRVQVTVRGHNGINAVVDCPIDRPEWDPSARPNRAAELTAWNSMRAVLDAHEARHRRIGEQWRATLQRRYRGINFTITGSDAADAEAQASQRVADLEQQWRDEAQAAQDAIDPFRGARLDCP